MYILSITNPERGTDNHLFPTREIAMANADAIIGNYGVKDLVAAHAALEEYGKYYSAENDEYIVLSAPLEQPHYKRWISIYSSGDWIQAVHIHDTREEAEKAAVADISEYYCVDERRFTGPDKNELTKEAIISAIQMIGHFPLNDSKDEWYVREES
jgi:hypothetical protein